MRWIYEINKDNSVRFALGQIFNPSGKTLLCFGINPSTACPESIDNTIRKIINISRYNGYENWIMLNVYPQRATNPSDLHIECDEDLVQSNLLHIRNISKNYSDSDVLLAYGNLISKRKYLKNCLEEILSLLNDGCRRSIKIIKLTRNGNPVHPLYQSKTSVLVDYEYECRKLSGTNDKPALEVKTDSDGEKD